MSFHLRHIFNIDVAAIATIVLSVALIVYVLLSIWGITGFPEKRHSSLRYRRTASLAGAAVSIPLTDWVHDRAVLCPDTVLQREAVTV